MIKRISKCYVLDDIVQVRFPFIKNLTVIGSDFNNEGVLCHYDFYSDSQNINKYIVDNRRLEFPYGTIPMYKEVTYEVGEEIEINYVNQILNFDKHYISVSDDFCVMDWYLVKEEDTAVMCGKNIVIPNSVKDMETSRQKLELEYKNKVILCVTRSGQNINFNKKFSAFFNDKGGLLVIREDGELKFRLVELIVRGRYLYMKEYDIPFNNYTLDELKFYCSKIKNESQPKISYRFNPNIDRKEVKTSRRLVKKLNK